MRPVVDESAQRNPDNRGRGPGDRPPPVEAPETLRERLYADAERRLGRKLTDGERRRDVAAIDQALEQAKEQLVEAIEQEKRRAIAAIARDVRDGRPARPGIFLTDAMREILLDLFDAGQAHAETELAAAGIPTAARSFAVRDEPQLDYLLGTLSTQLGGIDLRIGRTAAELQDDLVGLSLSSIEREIDRRVPGARAAAAEVVSGAFDAGMGMTFETHGDLVGAWTYSAMMDAATCEECRRLDGTSYATWEEIQRVLPNGGPNPRCHGRGRCRCMAVPEGPSEAATSAPTEGGSTWPWAAGETRFSVEPKLPPGYDEWAAALSDEERAAIADYTGGSYQPMNGALRGDRQLDEENAARIRALDQAIASAPEYDEPVVVWRGVRTDVPVGVFDDPLEAALDQARRGYEPGATVRLDGYQSSSFWTDPALDASLARRHPGIVYEIRARRGLYVGENLSKFDDEAELILPHGGEYRVVSVTSERFEKGEFGEVFDRVVVRLEQL